MVFFLGGDRHVLSHCGGPAKVLMPLTYDILANTILPVIIHHVNILLSASYVISGRKFQGTKGNRQVIG